MMSFKWISDYCPNSKYILRVNDLVLVNTYKLINHFKQSSNEVNMIYGNIKRNTKPSRDPDSKYYLSYQQYNKTYLEDYPEGAAYVMTTDLAYRLYNSSLYVEYILIEGFYIGLLAKTCKTTLVNTLKFVKIDSALGESSDVIKDKLKKQIKSSFFIFVSSSFFDYWQFISFEMNKTI